MNLGWTTAGRSAIGPIGLDVGARQVKAAQLRRSRAGSLEAVALACLPRVAGAPASGLAVGEAHRIADVLARQGFEGRDVVLVVPDEKLMTANLELPPRAPGVPLDQIAQAEFARALKVESHEFEFAYWDLPAPARAARATHVMGVGCRHGDCDPTIDALSDAGLSVVAIDVGAAALTRACAAWTGAANEITALVDFGLGAARLLIAYRGVVCYQRSLPGFGVQRLRRALSEHLDLADAPELVDHMMARANMEDASSAAAAGTSGSVSPVPVVREATVEEAQRIMRAHADAVLSEVMTSLSYSSHQYPDAPAKRVLLTGGGANLPGIGRYLSARLKLDVRSVRPADVATVAQAIPELLATDASLTLAVGLASHTFASDQANTGGKAVAA